METDYQTFIAISKYARYIPEEGKREEWKETVRRYIKFWVERNDPETIPYGLLHEIEDNIVSLDVMPSMRALMTAGEALYRDEVAGYNCAYLPVESPRDFDEAMYILMCGTGVGFSVEHKYVSKLPTISEEFYATDTVINVSDSKIGWAKSLRELISLLYAGQIPKWDTSKVRPSGDRLKTFGGRASGPQPLEDLFQFTVDCFTKAKGRKLSSIECHDIMCKIGDIVVVGGVRRSAMISLSDLGDSEMRHAKYGAWYDVSPHRALANNSVCYESKPSMTDFMKEWRNLYDSKSGERGIFSRDAAKRHISSVLDGRRNPDFDFGTNPCSEIILRPQEFCNLTEVVVRPSDTLETLKKKVRFATILGTIQSTLTNFRYLRKKWQDNCEEERLLGVSLTGIMDHHILSNGNDAFTWEAFSTHMELKYVLQELKEVAIETNKEWAERLGISPSAAITCVKPSGTVSQLVNSSSGIHPRYSEYYIRTVRSDKKDPLYTFLKEQGVPVEDAIGKEDSTAIFSFPVSSPEGSTVRDQVSAIEQLKLWKIYSLHWCEHKPSITVYVREEEWMEVGAWVYKNFDIMSGISLLPYDGGIYKQAPYQPITKEEYAQAIKEFPKINWEEFKEEGDNTTSSQELACTGNSCEVI